MVTFTTVSQSDLIRMFVKCSVRDFLFDVSSKYFILILSGSLPSQQTVSALFSPLCRYFSNITLGGRDYSFSNEGYLANPFLDVISYMPGSGWEDVSTNQNSISVRSCVTAVMDW